MLTTVRSTALSARVEDAYRALRFRNGTGVVDEAWLAFDVFKVRQRRGIMVDVGAHHGGTLWPFLAAGWQVYAFEPDSENRRVLERRFPGRRNLHVDPRAVLDRTQSDMPLFRSPVSNGISGLLAFHSSHKVAERVQGITLTEFLDEKKLGSVDFLKIDTEGYDLMVLRGLDWSRWQPQMIVCEFEDAKTVRIGYTMRDLADLLITHAYRVIVSEWRPILRYGDRHEWRRFSCYPCGLADERGWGNLIAVREPSLFQAALGRLRRYGPVHGLD